MTTLAEEGNGFGHPPIEGVSVQKRGSSGETYASITASMDMQLLSPATQRSGSLKPTTGESPGMPEVSIVPRKRVATNWPGGGADPAGRVGAQFLGEGERLLWRENKARTSTRRACVLVERTLR